MIECCGNCAYYTYEGKNSKGFCEWYRSYYYPTDSCSHFKEGDEETVTESGSCSSCFLTTACCSYKGLPDDCMELETLRAFRDDYLMRQEYGPKLIRIYYEDAPAIVRMIQGMPNRDAIWQSVYDRIGKIVDMIHQESYEVAVIYYLMMVYELKQQV